ncbi:signal peptide peptidase SppA [Apibacter raozihei]|uniref:signal peptide peptidase SppA n=1 Tax=Apibacter raozihei TaxID=2500547 RepID=UPI000FE31C6F|nr:signal peptide peptidase SppA [Apibacter raozihei]
MKKFTIQVLATIVGIMLLIGLFFISSILFGSIFLNKSTTKVKDNSILEITLNKSIIESSSEKNVSVFTLSEEAPLYFKDILDLINYAKTDDKIKGISLKLSNPEVGYSELSEIRQALQNFKESKKFVYSYLNDCSQKAYYLSSVADSLYLNPNATLELTGLSTEVMFFKNLGEKYGIGFDVIRHGKYKSAVEPYMRDNLSDENRQQLTELLGNIWGKVSQDISSSRKVSVDNLNKATDSLYGFISDKIISNKLVDKLINESDYDLVIKNKLGLDKGSKINKVSLTRYKETAQLNSSTKNKIALLYASGQIFSGKGEDGGIYSQSFIKQIHDIKENKDVKAVVLRINSPGGSSNASAEILYELEKLKKEKPIVVSFSDVAASGGYYIAMAADKIYAQENTITGSIGVLGLIPNVKKLANNVGITTDYVSTNANSAYYSVFNGLSDGAKNVLTKEVEIVYKKFVGVVMKNRKMTFEQVDALGGGRVWSGSSALKNGLIDQIGTFDDAIKYSAKLVKLNEYSTVTYPVEKTFLETFLSKMKSDEDDDQNIQSEATEKLIKNELGKEKYMIYQRIKNIDKERGIMYLMPYDMEIK